MATDTTRVEHLSSDAALIYGLPPRQAVRNAYAQATCGDWNTWTYAKYDKLVVEGARTVACGDWCALK